MSDTPLYRYTGTGLARPGGYVETGDIVEPTEAELAAFGDLFERVDPDEAAVRATSRDDASSDDDEADSSEAADGDADDAEPEADAQPTEDDADADDSAAGADEAADAEAIPNPERVLADYLDDPSDYASLRALAAEVEGVPGSGLSTEELQERLAEAALDGRL